MVLSDGVESENAINFCTWYWNELYLMNSVHDPSLRAVRGILESIKGALGYVEADEDIDLSAPSGSLFFFVWFPFV